LRPNVVLQRAEKCRFFKGHQVCYSLYSNVNHLLSFRAKVFIYYFICMIGNAVPIKTDLNVFIVEIQPELAQLWRRHLERQGMQVSCVGSQEDAIAFLATQDVDIIILDLVLEDGSALAVADYANYRQPDARVIFVTNTTFFSDGSIFAHSANARAFLPLATPPDDLAAMVAHYGSDM
jgi:CheY-like chemotaxis protein